MFSAPPAATSSAPSDEPFAQLTTALLATVRLAPAPTVPLFQFNNALEDTVNVTPEPSVPLFQFNTAAAGTVSEPDRLMARLAVSDGPGTWFGFQFAATFQSPPAALVQVMVSAWPRTSAARKRIKTENGLKPAARILFFIYARLFPPPLNFSLKCFCA